MVNHFTRACRFESGNRLAHLGEFFDGGDISRETDLLCVVDELQTLHGRIQSALAYGFNRKIVFVRIFKNVFSSHMGLTLSLH